MHGLHYLQYISMKQIGITMAKYVNWLYLHAPLTAEQVYICMYISFALMVKLVFDSAAANQLAFHLHIHTRRHHVS